MALKKQANRGKKTGNRSLASAVFPYLIIVGAAAALLLVYALVVKNSNTSGSTPFDDGIHAWQDCSIFTAPSKLPGGGWGVFAARSFEENEVVEVAPLYVPMDVKAPAIKNTVLDDYVYKSDYYDGTGQIKRAMFVSLGYIQLNNHHPEPNLSWNWMGRPPHPDRRDEKSFAIIYKASRRIEAGEELYSNYGQSHDGGGTWFKRRGLTLKKPTMDSKWKAGNELKSVMEKYCPKLYSGPGRPTWEKVESSDRLKSGETAHPVYDRSRLAPADAGYENVVAKTTLEEGDIIEQAPTLVIRKSLATGTELEGLIFGWDHLTAVHKAKLEQLRSDGYINMQYQGEDTRRADYSWKREDRWDGFHEVALFPMGSIGMIQRVGSTPAVSNCRVEIRSSINLDERDEAGVRGNAGLFLALVATRSILPGEVLRLNLPAAEHTKALRRGLTRMGQLVIAPASTVKRQFTVEL